MNWKVQHQTLQSPCKMLKLGSKLNNLVEIMCSSQTVRYAFEIVTKKCTPYISLEKKIR